MNFRYTLKCMSIKTVKIMKQKPLVHNQLLSCPCIPNPIAHARPVAAEPYLHCTGSFPVFK